MVVASEINGIMILAKNVIIIIIIEKLFNDNYYYFHEIIIIVYLFPGTVTILSTQVIYVL